MEAVVLEALGHVLLHYSTLLERPQIDDELVGALAVGAPEQDGVGVLQPLRLRGRRPVSLETPGFGSNSDTSAEGYPRPRMESNTSRRPRHTSN